jgi:exopolysaccharide biosynthesis polyprenyl glycosylphosphotransferase
MDLRGNVTSSDARASVLRSQHPLAVDQTVAAVALEHQTHVPAAEARPAVRRSGDLPWVRACLTVDVLMLVGAVATAELGAARAGVASLSRTWMVAFPLLVVVLLWARRMYAPRLSLRVVDDIRAVAFATTIAAMALVTLRALGNADASAAADQAARLWAFSTVLVLGGRALLFSSEIGARRRAENLAPTLIVGAGHVGRLTAKRLAAHPELGLRPIGFLDKDPLATADDDAQPPVLGASWDLETVVQTYEVEQVIVTFSTAPHEVLLRLARRCEELDVRMSFVPRLFDRMTERVHVDHVGGIPLISAEFANPKGLQFAVKHAIDRVTAATLLTLLAPVLVLAAIGVRVSVGRPILFRQTRVGRDGTTFEMLKLRSMRTASMPAAFELPTDTAPGGVEGLDLRTGFGDFLRRTSLDELPQLLNVVKGEMSLVGPRPERPEYVDLFADAVRRYDDRHRVKAGITGWAQVNGLRGKTSISERVELDNYYVQNWTLWLDVKILLMTIAAVFRSYRSVE